MRTCSPWLWVPLVCGTVGCANRGGDRAEVYPARGAVFFSGKPAAGAVVRVHGGDGGVVSRGVVQKDGSFALTTAGAGDGVPPGHYRVSVYWRRQSPDGESDGPPLIPERYSRPESSGLEVEIKAGGENALTPFQLKP